MSTRHSFAFVLPFVTLALLSGCSSYRGEVNTLMEAEDWSAATSRLEDIVESQPDDAWAWRQLGRARLKAGEPDRAVHALRESQALVPDHGYTLFYLATAHEELGQPETALRYYASCAAAPEISFSLRDHVKARTFYLNRLLYRQRARELIREPAPPEDNVLAVHSFTTSDTSAAYRALGKGLAVILISDLSKVRSIRLVERLEVQTLLDEIAMGREADLVDDRTRARAGHLIGARRSVSGNILRTGTDDLRMSYYVVYNETGNLVGEASVPGQLEDFLALEKEIVYGIIDVLGIDLTEFERREIGKIPTTSYPAFLAFCQGVDLEDRGDYFQAYDKYQQAISMDPGFEAAVKQASGLSDVIGDASAAANPAVTDPQGFAELVEPDMQEHQVDMSEPELAADAFTGRYGPGAQSVTLPPPPASEPLPEFPPPPGGEGAP
jgi:tetratricopeptide (TPR) repeat protein